MDKWKLVSTVLVIGIVVGVLVGWFLLPGLKARLTGVDIGPLEFEFPTETPGSEATESIAEPTATSSQAQPGPTSATSRYHLVSLREVGKSESGNLGLQVGVTTLVNVDFEIGWLATTQSQGDSSNPEMIVINAQQNVPNPSEVHFLLQASWAVGQSQEFGGIYITFANGRTINEPLKVGYNIRDWSQVNTPLTAPNAQQAWEGVGWDGHTKGIVDVLTVNIPSDYRQSQIVRIEIRDESVQKLDSLNPGIHVWAITIEQ